MNGDLTWEDLTQKASAEFKSLDDDARAQYRRTAHTRKRDGKQQARKRGSELHLAPNLQSGHMSSNNGSGPQKSGLPTITVNNRPMREVTAEAVGALLERNNPPRLFKRGVDICRIRLETQGHVVIEALGEASLRGELDRAANFFRDSKGDLIPVPPPIHVVRDLSKLLDLSFPPIEAVLSAPVLRPDGSVLDRPGYDPKTRLYYQPKPDLLVPQVAQTPTDEDRRRARDLLEEVVHDFPFVDQASKANTLALMLTLTLRQAIDGPVPLALDDAPRQGTGKTLLAEVVGVIATGAADLMPFPNREEERQKLITSGLAEGATLFIFDNLTDKIRSPSLARVLTAETMADRILGHTKVIRLPQRATWIATANNVTLGGDLGRRCYWIRLDAEMARPWLRKEDDFKHPKLLRWVRENRGLLIWALLVLARAWYAAGCPKAKTPQMGKFEQWCEVVGGVLAHAGVVGFLGNQEAMYDELDEGDAEWEGFLEAWRARFGSVAMTVSELVAAIFPEDGVGTADELRTSVPADLVEGFEDRLDRKRRTSFARRLGIALMQRKHVRYGETQIHLTPARKDTHKKANAWRVVLGGGSAGAAEVAGRDSVRNAGTDQSASNLPPALPQLPHSRDCYDDQERKAIQDEGGIT